MYSRTATLIIGLIVGLAAGAFAVLAIAGGGAERQPDPVFDVDLFEPVTPSPGATRTHDVRNEALDRVMERLERVKDDLPTPVPHPSLTVPTPEPTAAARSQADASRAQPEPESEDGNRDCISEHSEEDGVVRSSIRCETRIERSDGSSSSSINITTSSSTSVSSTSPDSE